MMSVQHQSDEAHGKHMQRTLGQTGMRQVKREACACRRHDAFDDRTRLQSGIRAEEYPRKRGKAEGDNHADDLQPACVPTGCAVRRTGAALPVSAGRR